MFTLEEIGVDTKNYELTHKLAKGLREAHERLGLKIEKKKIPKYFYAINHYHPGLRPHAKQVVEWYYTQSENDYLIKTLDQAIDEFLDHPITKGWTTTTSFTPNYYVIFPDEVWDVKRNEYVSHATLVSE